MVDSPCISSFVIRIVEESDPQFAASPYRGTIRHIQSDEETSFTRWEDAESFIERFVPIALMKPKQDGSQAENIKDQSLGNS